MQIRFAALTHAVLPRLLIAACVAAAMMNGGPVRANSQAIDVQHSKMTVYVYKQGPFSFLADDHEINAPITTGSYDDAARVVDVTVDATKMQVLDPKSAASKRDKVQSNMASSEVLDVARYPTISFRSTTIVSADPNHWAITGNLTLHGQTHPVALQVVKQDATHFTGSTTVRQTTFGITPIKVAGGTVSVKDDVKVEFEVALSP